MLISNHLPGKLNWEADLLSRVIPDCWDWKLNPQIFKEINLKLGPLSLDLFANRWNAQLKNFYSWKAQPTALGTDALSQKWPKTGAYAFPPVILIPAVLNKIIQDKIEKIVVVTPAWTTQNWYAKILNMITKHPTLIPKAKNLLKNSQEENHPLLEQKSFHLVAWTLSGNPTNRWDSQKKPLDLCQMFIDNQLSNPMMPPGVGGLAGVTKMGLAKFLRL